VVGLRQLVQQPQLAEESVEDRHERLMEFLEHYHTRDSGKTCMAKERSSGSWRIRQTSSDDTSQRLPLPPGTVSVDRVELPVEDIPLLAPLDSPNRVGAGNSLRGILTTSSSKLASSKVHPVGGGTSTWTPGSPSNKSLGRSPSGIASPSSSQASPAATRPTSKTPARRAEVQVVRRRPFTAELEEVGVEIAAPLRPLFGEDCLTWAVSSMTGPHRAQRRRPLLNMNQKVEKVRSQLGRALGAMDRVDSLSSVGRKASVQSMTAGTSSEAAVFFGGSKKVMSLMPETSRTLLDSTTWEGTSAASLWSPSTHFESIASQHCSQFQDVVELPALLPPDGGGPACPVGDSQQTYIGECQRLGLAPLLTPFITGHSTSLRLAGQALEDKQLLPITAMAKDLDSIDEIDFSGNARLTERSLVPLFHALSSERQAAEGVVRLSLNGCAHIGQATLLVVVKLLTERWGGMRELQELDLSGIRIHTHTYVPLASAIGRHATLRSVVLTDTGLGQGIASQTCMILSELLRGPMLEILDLGWSRFSAETFAHLGTRMANASRLHSLSVPNCSATALCGNDIPAEYFLERLSNVRALTRLDISLNKIDLRGALVLEDALEHHLNFRDLNISDNALGVNGLRSILRLLARDTSGLVKLQMEHCAQGNLEAGEEDPRQVFSVTSPGGRYSLDLSRPYHRALLRMLHKTCERFACKPQLAFQDLVSHSGPYHHLKKDEQGLWVTPKQGQITFTFGVFSSKSKSKETEDLGDFSSFLQKHSTLVRLQPSFHKVIPLFAHWKALAGRNAELLAILDALGMDFSLTYPQLRELARNRELANEVICRMLHCVTGGPVARYLSMLLAPTIGHYEQNYARVQSLITFNTLNPNGHYCLDLMSPGQYVIADQLMLLDRWEVEIDESLKRPDVSQWGMRTHVRNLEHQGRALRVKINEWRLPTFDTLELDYVSGKRPPDDAHPLDHKTFSRLLHTLHQSSVEEATKIDMLRRISHWIYLKSSQMRELLGAFDSDGRRDDIFVLFYFRIVDMQNEKIFRSRFDDHYELEKLWDRLGWATSFPFVQPERTSFRLDLQYHDCRLATTFIIQLMNREQQTNVRNASFVDAQGQVDPLTLGIPRLWENLDRLPTSGVFRATYICAPEDRNFTARKSMMEKFGWWKLMVPEKSVVWWTGLTEAPIDVQIFMQWLISRFADINETFTRFQHGGKITLREFEDTLAELNCDRFRGVDGPSRVQAVFRFLDPSGEGGVSQFEWQVLEQLYQEMTLSLEEFVWFLAYVYNHHPTFLEQAWSALDEDGSGEISEEEWHSLVKKRLRYFGPSATIFAYLDVDRQGTISPQEFRVLRRIALRSGALDVSRMAQPSPLRPAGPSASASPSPPLQ